MKPLLTENRVAVAFLVAALLLIVFTLSAAGCGGLNWGAQLHDGIVAETGDPASGPNVVIEDMPNKTRDAWSKVALILVVGLVAIGACVFKFPIALPAVLGVVGALALAVVVKLMLVELLILTVVVALLCVGNAIYVAWRERRKLVTSEKINSVLEDAIEYAEGTAPKTTAKLLSMTAGVKEALDARLAEKGYLTKTKPETTDGGS